MSSDLKGMFGKSSKLVSIDDMNESIARCAAGAMHNPLCVGEVFQEYLGPISLADDVLKLGLGEEVISGLLAGTSIVSPETANLLGAAFGTSTEIWLGLQA